MTLFNYFIVCSPFQLINATEAREYYNIPDNKCVLVILNLYGKTNYNQIISVLEDYIWTNVHKLSFNSRSNKLTFPFKLRKLVSIYKGVKLNKLFVGEYFAYEIRALANIIAYKEIILFDDGNAAIRTINYLSLGRKKPSTFSFQTLRKLYYQLSGLKVFEYASITIFTAYADLYNYLTAVKIVKNSYAYSRSLNRKKEISSEIFFLGTKFVERGLIDLENYTEYLKRAITYLEKRFNGNVLYVPHRGENKEKIEYLKKKKNIKIKTVTTSIELYLLKSSQNPMLVSTFSSSAIFSLEFIFGDDMNKKCFQLTLKKGLVSKSYNEYRKLGIEVIEQY